MADLSLESRPQLDVLIEESPTKEKIEVMEVDEFFWKGWRGNHTVKIDTSVTVTFWVWGTGKPKNTTNDY